MAENQIEKLFGECDVEGTGFLCREGMRELCARVSVCAQDADAIFQALDTDADGKISLRDISTGLSAFLNQNGGGQTPDSETDFIHHRPQSVVQAWQHFATEVGKSDKIISQENILELYKELETSGKPHLISQFESVMADLMENVSHLQEEKHRLEHFWKRERKEQELYLHRMEEEMSNQVKDLELKVKREAQEEVETERKNLNMKMDAEMDELQAHLSLFEKVNTWLQSCNQHHFRDEKSMEIRSKLEEALHENHQLRMNLIDTQTSVALMRSEMAQLRNQYQDKCRELDSEKERIVEVLHEHSVLGRQIHYLHDANMKLNDTNDTLREAVQKSPVDNLDGVFARWEHRGSVIGDYLYNDVLLESRKRICSEDVEFEDGGELNNTQTIIKDDLDSGFSTLRDFSEEPEEGIRPDSTVSQPWQHPPLAKTQTLPVWEKPAPSDVRRIKSWADNESSPSSESKSEENYPRRKIADIKRQLGLDPNKAGRPRSLTPSPVPLPRSSLQTTSKKLRSSSASLHSKSEIQDENVKEKIGTPKKEKRMTEEEAKNQYRATGPAERTYKIVFIGDAAVGKSSFILRLSKGMFVAHLNSTLGVDFQVKTLRMDDKNIALQLWDTAGQERFRSITQSYFRKTDGVMLLYDCTNESSFLNVRQWMEAIDVSCFYRMMAKPTAAFQPNVTCQKIPVMIVANKTDLREVRIVSGHSVVPYESGEKLAKDFGAMFMEASAKSGDNVFEAVAQLTRSMSINEELQVKSSVISLKEGSKKSGKCCKT